MHRFTAIIACCAMLLSALAPSISHAIAAGKPAGTAWLEICSTLGVKSIKVTNAASLNSQAPANSQTTAEHCAICFTQTEVLMRSPVISTVLALDPAPAAFPPLFYQSPRPLFLWTKAPSRAPPFAI